jgi:hypothetical protein
MLPMSEWAKLSERTTLTFFVMPAQSDLVLMNRRGVNPFRWSSLRGRALLILRLLRGLWRLGGLWRLWSLLWHFGRAQRTKLNVLKWHLLLNRHKLRHRLNIDEVHWWLVTELERDLGVERHWLSVNLALWHDMRLEVASRVLLKSVNRSG